MTADKYFVRHENSLQCRRILASEAASLIKRTPSWIQTRKRLGEKQKCVPGRRSQASSVFPRPLPTYFAQANMAANLRPRAPKRKRLHCRRSVKRLTEVCFFLAYKCFSLFFFFFEDLEIIQSQNRKPNNVTRKPDHKVSKLKPKFSVILIGL